jgi:thermostable 8-oxoguanine DNA glycosylase
VSLKIDPQLITNYNRNKYQKESFLLYCIVAAGKTAKTQAAKLNEFLKGITKPFNYIKELVNDEQLYNYLVKSKLGQYKRIEKSFEKVVDLDLDRVTVDELVRVKGIGPKTARFFVMHSRKGERVATLDVHILKWLREQGVENVPSQTPQSSLNYNRLEKAFLELAEKMGRTPAELDLQIWREKSQKSA